MTKEKIVDIISKEVWVAHDSTVYGIEEAADKIVVIINKNDLLTKKLALAIINEYYQEHTYSGGYCTFCRSKTIIVDEQIKHDDDCVVQLAKKLLEKEQ